MEEITIKYRVQNLVNAETSHRLRILSLALGELVTKVLICHSLHYCSKTFCPTKVTSHEHQHQEEVSISE